MMSEKVSPRKVNSIDSLIESAVSRSFKKHVAMIPKLTPDGPLSVSVLKYLILRVDNLPKPLNVKSADLTGHRYAPIK
jgi:hypothetical protein